MASKRRFVTAALVLLGLPAVLAAQGAQTPKPLVRKDLLVLGTGAPPPLIRDIFRPKATAAAPAVGRPTGPVLTTPAVAPPETAPAFTLSISYLGSIKAAGGRTIGLVLRGGKSVDVAEGDEIAPGYRVVGVTAEAIVIEGPNGERRTFTKQGDRP
jgi:hypothetical protein